MSLLPDLPARLRALTDLDSTLLVEAAAGTGKTALIAGRVTVCLINGIDPHNVAAITFNELAASELSARIHDFVSELLKGRMPECMQPAFPRGLSAEQKARLETGAARIDELTITTLHGFCQTTHSQLRSRVRYRSRRAHDGRSGIRRGF
jgi:CRISPR-associated exonuclease Cas4